MKGKGDSLLKAAGLSEITLTIGTKLCLLDHFSMNEIKRDECLVRI